jgi:hypothetical protein
VQGAGFRAGDRVCVHVCSQVFAGILIRVKLYSSDSFLTNGVW